MASEILCRVSFTAEVDQALSAWRAKTQLTYVRTATIEKRAAAVRAVRAELEKPTRRQYYNLITLYHEQIALLDEMLAGTPASIWRGEMRYYQNASGTICCRCGENEITIGDDQPAASTLACTKVTRKARLSMITAMASGKVFAATGPPGSGKTETIKDICHMLGMQAQVINCNETLREAPKEAIEAALKSGGSKCPVVFDEFNRLGAEAMTAIVEATAAKTFAAVTFNPASATAMPEALTANLVEQPMSKPDLTPILQVMLAHEGFLKCDELGRALSATVAACEEKTSACAFYDFGLRFCRSVVKTAGGLGRARGFADEAQLLADTLAGILYVRSTAADKPIVLEQIKQGVGVAAALPAAFEAEAGITARIGAMVAAQAKVRHGLAIVGGVVDTDALVGAIDAVMGAESVVLREPAEALLGAGGPFERALEVAATKGAPVNLVVATRLTTAQAEPLHTLLDDNKAFRGVKLAANVRVILLDDDCALWSPALVSRVGIVAAL